MLFDKISFIKNNHFIKNNLIVFAGSFGAGVGGYVYNMLMGRMLGPADYGELSSLVSLFYIISVISSTLSIAVSRNISELKAQNRMEEGSRFISKINGLLIKMGILVFVLFVFFSSIIADFLRISSISPVIILGTVLGISLIGTANAAGLQGLQKFFRMSLNSILHSVLKVALAVFFVWMGFGVAGALGAMAFAAAAAALLAYYWLDVPKKFKSAEDTNKINITSAILGLWPVFLTALSLTALYNIDVILAKHFFAPEEAGYYSVLSLLGRIIFFITGSVAIVLFPTVVERHNKNEKYSHVVKYSLLLVSAFSLIIVFLYFIAPNLIIKILFGGLYLPAAPYLGYFGLAMMFFSLINLLAVYNLSLKRTSFVPFLIFGLIIEIGLIYLFHQTIWQIIEVMITAMAVTLFLMLIFYYKTDVKRKHSAQFVK